MSTNTIQTELSAYTRTEDKKLEIMLLEDHDVKFPFEWVIGERVITMITELSHEEKENARKNKRECSLCGSKEIEYEKESGRFSHLICADCATRYVRNAYELNGSKR